MPKIIVPHLPSSQMTNLDFISLDHYPQWSSLITRHWNIQLPSDFVLPIIKINNLPQINETDIITALIKVLVYSPQHPFVSLYKILILKIKKNISSSLYQGALVKWQQKNYFFSQELFIAHYILHPSSLSVLHLALFYDKISRLEKKSSHFSPIKKWRDAMQEVYLLSPYFSEDWALKYYHQAQEFSPPHVASFFYLAHFYRKRKLKFYQAKKQYLSFLRSLTQLSEKEAAIYEKQKKISHHYLENIKKYQKNKQNKTTISLMRTLLQEKKWTQLLHLSEKELNNTTLSSSSSYLYYKAIALKELKQYPESLLCFHKLLTWDEHILEIYNHMISIHRECHQYVQAHLLLRKALNVDDSYLPILFNATLLAFYEKKKEKAHYFLKKILSVDPHNMTAKNYLTQLDDFFS